LWGKHVRQFIFILSQGNQFSSHVDVSADCAERIRRGKFPERHLRLWQAGWENLGQVVNDRLPSCGRYRISFDN
jgi:hypothetical protein